MAAKPPGEGWRERSRVVEVEEFGSNHRIRKPPVKETGRGVFEAAEEEEKTHSLVSVSPPSVHFGLTVERKERTASRWPPFSAERVVLPPRRHSAPSKVTRVHLLLAHAARPPSKSRRKKKKRKGKDGVLLRSRLQIGGVGGPHVDAPLSACVHAFDAFCSFRSFPAGVQQL